MEPPFSQHPPHKDLKHAFVTLATNDSYCLGALVLGNSLKRTGSVKSRVCMITDEVTHEMKGHLEAVFDEVNVVTEFDSGDLASLSLMDRPELGITFTKLHCWKLTTYEKCVFLDADTLVRQNVDELFDREEISAAPDAGWPDCFNSGVFVFKPSTQTFAKLVEFANRHGSFDGGDQGLLNMYFSDWATSDSSRRLPFLYNMCATATYTYLPAYRHFGKNVRIVHFIGASKPWQIPFDEANRPQARQGEEHTMDHIKYWWQIFHTDVRPNLTKGFANYLIPKMLGYSDPVSKNIISWDMALGRPEMAQCGTGGGAAGAWPADGAMPPKDSDNSINRQRWEQGNPDIQGAASTDNILKKISETMATSPGN